VLAISLGYILLGVIGYGVMRPEARPAVEDRLARRLQLISTWPGGSLIGSTRRTRRSP